MEIIARLTKDAVVKTFENDRQVVNFSVAINRSYKRKGASEATKVTTYVDCSYWGPSGIAKYLTKGTLVELYGYIGVDAYINNQGEAKGVLRFTADKINLHGGGKSGSLENKQSAQPVKVIAGEITEPLDDLPF